MRCLDRLDEGAAAALRVWRRAAPKVYPPAGSARGQLSCGTAAGDVEFRGRQMSVRPDANPERPASATGYSFGSQEDVRAFDRSLSMSRTVQHSLGLRLPAHRLLRGCAASLRGALALILLTAITPIRAHADWLPTGSPITTLPWSIEQGPFTAVPDDSGGAIVGWGNVFLFASRVTGAGDLAPGWAEGVRMA